MKKSVWVSAGKTWGCYFLKPKIPPLAAVENAGLVVPGDCFFLGSGLGLSCLEDLDSSCSSVIDVPPVVSM